MKSNITQSHSGRVRRFTLNLPGFKNPKKIIQPGNQKARKFIYRTENRDDYTFVGIVAHKRCQKAAAEGKHYYTSRKTKSSFIFDAEVFLREDKFYVYADGRTVRP
jgi:hypothetical protein